MKWMRKCVCCVFVCVCMYCVVHVHLCGVYYEHFTLLVDCQRGALHNLRCSLPYVCKSPWHHCLLLNSMCWSSWSIRCEWVWSSSPARRLCAGSCIVLYCMYVCVYACLHCIVLYCTVCTYVCTHVCTVLYCIVLYCISASILPYRDRSAGKRPCSCELPV